MVRILAETPIILTETYRGFSHFIQEIDDAVPKLFQGPFFFSDPFQFIVYLPPHH
jgi:hypothetical protein